MKRTSRKHPLCGHASEAGFGKLRYLDAARLKAGAHYTGIRQKREIFYCQNPVMGLAVAGPGVPGTTVCFAPARRCGGGRSAERRVGKECVSTCSSRWSPNHSKKTTRHDQTVQQNE